MQVKTSRLGLRIGRIVREARYAQSLSQEDLAMAAGVSTRTLHSIEHGASGVRLDTLLRILSVLGMALEIADAPARRISLEPDQESSA